jgi:NAD(P)-dependent dehydrogenase (short-subunit alcohol dehydrogenase family)
MTNDGVVVITGASGGVGRATAIAMARTRPRVALLARGRAGLDAAAADIEAAGGTPLAIEADVADPAQVEAAADQIETDLGPIEVWVNNAIATVFAEFQDIEPDEYRRATEVTYLGTVWGTMAALRRMQPRRRGTIIQVGSALSYRAIPLQAAYCGGKFAVRGFTDSLRCELLHQRSPIRLCMIQLPALNTPQFDWSRAKVGRRPRPVAPIYQPQVAAEAICWAADHDRRELWVGARNTFTILANHLIPGALDFLLGQRGYELQQDPEPCDPRVGNLFTPDDLERDYGVNGRFNHEAHPASTQLELAKRRPFARALDRPLGALLARLS